MNNIELLYQHFSKYRTFSTDTRNITKNSIFFALKGSNFNGNDFAIDAINKGASYSVVDEDINESSTNVIRVDNVLQFLQDFALYHRKQLSIPVIGITGTNGKTTSKELLASVLSSKYKCSFTKGNLNNHIGVPITILSIPQNTEIAIIEMGANKPGDIKELANICLPTHGILTNVGQAHLEGFGSFQGVINTKCELYEFIHMNSGFIFINGSDNILKEQLKNYPNTKLIEYNCSSSNVKIINFNLNPYLKCNVDIDNSIFPIHTKLFGEYNTTNIALSISVGLFFNIEVVDIIKSLESYNPSNNRSQIIETKKDNKVVMDAYNANPSSMKLAIESFIKSDLPNKIYILGDMLELGEFSKNEHEKVLNFLPKKAVVYLIGENFYKHKNNFEHFNFYKDSMMLNEFLVNNPIKLSSILIKGSRSIKLETIIDRL